MRALLSAIVCRLLGRRCTVKRPASRDLVRQMTQRANQTEATTVELRKRREDLARTFGGQR